MQLHLFRHFAHQGKVGAFYGSTDLALKELMPKPLKIHEDTKIFSSPLLRCRQSLECLNLKAEVHLDFAKEVDFGAWEGLTYSEIEKNYPQEVKDWQRQEEFAFPQGEKLKAFHKRIEALAELINSQEQDVFLMTHGGVIRHLICHYLGLHYDKSLAFKVDTGSLSSIEIFPEGLGVLNSLNQKELVSWQALLS